MEGNKYQFTLRVSRNLMDRFDYVARYNGRTKTKELEMLMRRHIAAFEGKYGKIDPQAEIDWET